MHINYTEQLFYCYNVSFVLLVTLHIISKCPSSGQYVDMSIDTIDYVTGI